MNRFEDKDNLNTKSGEETPQRTRRKKQKETTTSNGEKKKVNIPWKKLIVAAVCLCLVVGVAGAGWVYSIIKKAPPIDTSNVYSLMSQSTLIYDANGEIYDNVTGADAENRTIVELKEIPMDLQDAFIALEDKTFRTHNGFNFIRIMGAIKDAVLGGGDISGTSTLTQQLARNLYLKDSRFERSYSRKVKEAYYTVIMEKEMNKDEILEAYLNTVPFGGQLYGVQAAAQAYFSKDVEELTLSECAALAALPQLPNSYALVLPVEAAEIADDDERLLKKDGAIAYVWNDTAEGRIKTCLALMLEQGLITQEEYDAAKDLKIKDLVKPNYDSFREDTNYFADYVINTVINDLQEELGYSYSEAYDMVHTGGLQIYSTVDPAVQDVVEREFEEEGNFPTMILSNRNSDGNVIDAYGNVLLIKYSNYFTEDGSMLLTKSEYEKNEDGSLTIFAGKKYHLYDTVVNDTNDVSVEFKNIYLQEDGILYTIAGGYVNIPQQYKSKDSEGNLVVSAQLFTDMPEFFTETEDGLTTKQFTLQQRIVQPQAAMTIIDNQTGHVKAMVGGRSVSGRMILNRAVTKRQSGSSIKPLSVYAPALQRSFELEAANKSFPLVDSNYGEQGDDLWGTYLTAASIIDDEPTWVEGRNWPFNSPLGYDGLITMRNALQKSLNVCAVKITQQVGVDYAYNLVEKFGITTLVPEGSVNDKNLAAIALGGQADGVTTLEMASAYTTFVNRGIHKSHNVYTKVTTRNDDVLLETTTTETKVLDEGVAWIMRDMLQSVVTNGLGKPATVYGAKAGGKTGTTSDQYDIWFDGFTAKYSAALWIGCDVNIEMSHMSNKAAALWGEIMNQVPGVASGSYSGRPGNVVAVEIDTKSGMLAGENSGSTRTEYFTKGTQPTETDNIHQTVTICSDSGYVATPSCKHTEEKSGLLRPYEPNKKVADFKQELPHYFCNEHNPDPEEYPVKEGLKVTIVLPEPEEPEEPETPSEPEEPKEPETPSEPEEPKEPETPSEPEEPKDPETPSEPEEPKEPETPSEPEEPKDPETPSEPVVQDLDDDSDESEEDNSEE